MAVVGILVAIQIKSVRATDTAFDSAQESMIDGLKAQMDGLEDKIALLEAQVKNTAAEYDRKIVELSQNDNPLSAEIKNVHSSIDAIKQDTGLTEVTGGGVIVTVSDGQSEGPYSQYSLVHDATIIRIISELKDAGATAISVNDQRIMAMTEIICVGPAVRVNNTKLFPPYEIKAAGDPEILAAAVSGGSVARNQKAGLLLTVEKHQNLTVPAYNKSYQNEIDLLGDNDNNG